MKTRSKLPPGPPGHFLVGNFPLGTRDPLKLLTQWAREYGDIFYYRAFATRVYFLNRPDLIESVLVTNSRDFIKGRGLQVNRRLFGNGLLTSEGDFWLRQRRLCQPAFHRDGLQAFSVQMVEYTERMLEGWHDGEVRDIQEELMRLTLQIAAKTLLGVEMGERVQEFSRAVQPIMQFNTRGRMLMPLVRYLPTPLNIRYRLAVRRLERIVTQMIRKRQAHGVAESDLLSVLIEARDEKGRGLTERQLRDEGVTLLLAGHETTALALCWTFYLLALHPEVESRLLEEIDEILGRRRPEFADLARLKYAESAIRESMRLYPPAYAMARIASKDCEIAGYRVPRGASLVMSQWVMHRDPRFFERPEEFIPDRWTGEFLKRLPNFAYFPFGGGPRVCLGASFAMMESILLLATILQRFRLGLCSEEKVNPVAAITLRPAHGIPMKLQRRELTAQRSQAVQVTPKPLGVYA
jgi:cytochrome P450